VRLFIAVWPPDSVLDAIEALPRPRIIGCRWTTRDQWHITLRFLGEVEEGSVGSVPTAISALGLPATPVALGPAVELLNPRILSVPVTGLEAIGPAVIAATAAIGQPPEDRPFRGHLTLARLKGVRKRELGDAIGMPISARWTVDEIHVVRSRLSPKGARYDSVAVTPLDDLSGTMWRLDQIGGSAALPGVRSTVSFGADGRVAGRGGVNQFGGAYKVDADSIGFGEMITTLMAGIPEVMDQERAFLDALSGTQQYSIDGDILAIGEARLQRIEPIVVSGRVSYRERMALPPNAVVIVRVVDVSKADAPSVTVAEQRIEPEHQVPIPFSLSVDPATLDPRHTYAVTARIEIDEKLAWTSDTQHPVAVDGPTEVHIPLVKARA
jgi:2'-5' RNA ligase